jgi:integrase
MAASLNESTVKKAPIPATGSTTLWDDAVTGFGLRIHSGGAKSFFLNFWANGTEKRITIGKFPTWTAARARIRAKELRKEVDAGKDPAREKRERREAPTIQDLVDRYVTEHLPTKANADGARHRDEKRILAEIGKHLGLRTPVADIHGGDVKKMHQAITDSGRPIRANRILAICSKAFSLSLVSEAGETRPWRDQAMGNPCKGVPRNHEEPRGKLYSQSELSAIGDALAAYPGVAADCVRLIMLSGARPSEAMKAKWDEFDVEPGCWVKPSAHTKQKKPHRLPLNPPALELVKRLRAKRSDSPYVFPGDVEGKPIVNIWHVWRFVRQHAGLAKSDRVYDLRHSYASLGAGGGLSLPIIGKLLGHTQARTTQRYADHVDVDPLRVAATKIGNLITGTTDVPDNVTNIGRRP